MITMVAAMSENRVIGRENRLPWNLSADIRHFREATRGHTVLMGRKTFQSIVARNGAPLPNRRNIVLTRSKTFSYPGVELMTDPQAITELKGDVYVIGGAEVYTLMLDVADRLDLTEIHAEIDGDAFFPKFDKTAWREVSREKFLSDESNALAYDFVIYERH